uniref:Uncharacterized protein n=1 Tax=Globodera rostochiensis TaxID=31243 RepID=A0A914HI68_GLORO
MMHFAMNQRLIACLDFFLGNGYRLLGPKRNNGNARKEKEENVPAHFCLSQITGTARIRDHSDWRTANIFVCADIWLDIFAFIVPGQLGLKLALLSNRFDCLVDKHFKTRKWALGKLEIRKRKVDEFVQIVKRVKNGRLQWLPMPQQPLPNSLVGFNEIIVRYVDQSVIEFLDQILRNVGANITLLPNIYSYFYSKKSWHIFIHQIWPMLKPNISRMMLDGESHMMINSDNFFQLRRHLSPAVLRECANLRSIDSDHLFPTGGAADDSIGTTNGKALSKWLHTPRGDGRPKVLKSNAWRMPGVVTKTFKELKEAFVNASSSVSYVVRVDAYLEHMEPFVVENRVTRECLTLHRARGDAWIMERGPIGRDEQQRAVWTREAMEKNWPNLLHFEFGDRDIGPLSPVEPSKGE